MKKLQQRILIEKQQRNELVDLIAPINFPLKRYNVWKAITNVLDLKTANNIDVFIKNVLEAIHIGRARFFICNYINL